MFVMNADRVPNLEKAEAPAAPRAHPLQRRPALQPLQPAESLSPPRSPVQKNDTRNEEMPKRHDDLPGIAERKSSKLTSSTKTSKTQKVPAITVAGSAGACYGHRPLSKQKFGSGYNQLPDRTVKVKEPKGLRTARGNKERLPQTRKLRPLPLEMKEDGTCQGIQGASQPSSSGSETLGSSRRERKTSKGRATEEEHGDSVTPSPTAAKRRAQRKLHKTAEIYGAPDAVGHTLRLPHALPRFERAEVNAGRSDTQVPLPPAKSRDALKLSIFPLWTHWNRWSYGLRPTPSSLDPLVKTAALARASKEPLRRKAKCFKFLRSFGQAYLGRVASRHNRHQSMQIFNLGPGISLLLPLNPALVFVLQFAMVTAPHLLPSFVQAKSVHALQRAMDPASSGAAPKRSSKRKLKVKGQKLQDGVPPAEPPYPKKRKSTKSTKPTKSDAKSVEVSAKAYRAKHAIVVQKSCLAPLATFQQARSSLGDDLVKAMEEQGYTAPTPIQAQAWPIALRGHDLVAVAKTGSGKTNGYLLPAMALIAKRGPCKSHGKHKTGLDERPPAQPSSLVMAPTRELVQQIAVEAKKLAPVVSARVLGIFGGVGKGPQVSALKAGVDLLCATPGRLRDFMTGDKTKAPVCLVDSVSYLVMDEADRMLDMGFEPEIRQIIANCPASGAAQEVLSGEARQTLFFTATWPPEVQRSALHFTHQAVKIQVGGASKETSAGLATNSNIKQMVRVVQHDDKIIALKKVIVSDLKPGETAIVFAGRKQTCDALEKELTWDPMKAEAPICAWCRALHGDKEQQDRQKALAAFRAITENPRKGQKGVLIATDVASRGLDIPGVALVVIFDYAESSTAKEAAESYVHRIGRTGRAGKEGRAITFFCPEKDVGAERLCQLLRAAGQEVPQKLEELVSEASRVEDARRSKEIKGKGKGKEAKGRGKAKLKGKGKGSPAETGTTEGCRARRRLSDKRGELDPLSGFGDQPRASQLSTIVPIQ
ncbi:unnamed protein product [Cladocopium goreaui]|uniref:RNA helicase n=1 Tax=Cladocopium goreaui TaxID=2562237 RepID=A0A9P1CZR2_9DINO|nr:unnamed protein product [Cladocopium goreaui]